MLVDAGFVPAGKSLPCAKPTLLMARNKTINKRFFISLF
jgi:hypothetical protein